MIEVIAMANPADSVNSSKSISIKNRQILTSEKNGTNAQKNSIDTFEKYLNLKRLSNIAPVSHSEAMHRSGWMAL